MSGRDYWRDDESSESDSDIAPESYYLSSSEDEEMETRRVRRGLSRRECPKYRKLAVSHVRGDLFSGVKLDSLPPNVIFSEILVHLIANILYLPSLTYETGFRPFYTAPGVAPGVSAPLGGVSREQTIWWLSSSLVEDPFMEERIRQSFGTRKLRTQALKVNSLFGWFSRDPLRHPWFVFRSLRMNQDEDGIWLRATTEALEMNRLDPPLRGFDWIPRYVFVNLEQVVFLKLPKIEDWELLQPQFFPSLKTWNCWSEERTGEPPDVTSRLVLTYPEIPLSRGTVHNEVTLPRFAGTELLCLRVDFRGFASGPRAVLTPSSNVDNLKRLTMIGDTFHLRTLPPLKSLEYLELRHVRCTVDAFRYLQSSLRTLILKACGVLRSFVARCMRSLVRLWIENWTNGREEWDEFLRFETLPRLRDLNVAARGGFKFLWLPRSAGLRSLVIREFRDRPKDRLRELQTISSSPALQSALQSMGFDTENLPTANGNEGNLLIRGLDLREVQYLHLDGVDIVLVENGAPIHENKFVLLENDAQVRIVRTRA